MRPGITTEEIIGLKDVFDSLEPDNGEIRVTKLKELYS